MLFIVQVARVRGVTQTVPFVVQVACVSGPWTVPSPSHPGVHAQDLPRRVSVLPSLCPCPNLHLQAAQRSLPWTRPGHLSALSSCSSLAFFLPAGGRQDVNPPGISGSLPRRLQVCAMSRQHAKLEVPKLWRARWALVCEGGCPCGVHGQCTPSGQTSPSSCRPGYGAGIGGEAARGGANGRRC